jgi:hypothetical protein
MMEAFMALFTDADLAMAPERERERERIVLEAHPKPSEKA